MRTPYILPSTVCDLMSAGLKSALTGLMMSLRSATCPLRTIWICGWNSKRSGAFLVSSVANSLLSKSALVIHWVVTLALS